MQLFTPHWCTCPGVKFYSLPNDRYFVPGAFQFMTWINAYIYIRCFLWNFILIRDHSAFWLSQWDTTLQCNVVSHWLSPNLEGSLLIRAIMTSSNGTFSVLLAFCAGNSPVPGVPGEFPAQRPVTQSFGVLFDLRLNKRLRKLSWGRWFETLSHPLWRHCNALTSGWR